MKVYKTENKLIKKYLELKKVKIFISKNEIEKERLLKDKNNFVIFQDDYQHIRSVIVRCINRHDFGNVYFTNMRGTLNKKIFVSKKLNIYFSHLNEESMYTLILHNFYKIKDTINKLGIQKLLDYYKSFEWNKSINDISVSEAENIEEYFYVGTLKDLVTTYKKEVEPNLDIFNPYFTDNMIFKYLNNYFSKLIVFNYNENVLKKF